MVKVLQIVLIIFLVGLAFQYRTKTRKVIQPRSGVHMGAHEFCVKVCVVCMAVFDGPFDYEDELVTKNYDDYFVQFNCVPKNLKGKTNATYWDKAHKWQEEAEEALLSLSVVDIVNEFDNGNAIEINLWYIFNVHRIVLCNKTLFDLVHSATTTVSSTVLSSKTTPSTASTIVLISPTTHSSTDSTTVDSTKTTVSTTVLSMPTTDSSKDSTPVHSTTTADSTPVHSTTTADSTPVHSTTTADSTPVLSTPTTDSSKDSTPVHSTTTTVSTTMLSTPTTHSSTDSTTVDSTKTTVSTTVLSTPTTDSSKDSTPVHSTATVDSTPVHSTATVDSTPVHSTTTTVSTTMLSPPTIDSSKDSTTSHSTTTTDSNTLPSTTTTDSSMILSSTTGDETPDSFCDDGKELATWINEQVEIFHGLDGMVHELPQIVEKLNVHIKRNCCPYPIIWDRIEVINDNVDKIMQLKSIEIFGQANSSGSVMVDLSNLLKRLKYLNQRVIRDFKMKCCPDWENEIKDFENKFYTKIVSFPDLSIVNSIFVTLLYHQHLLNLNVTDMERNAMNLEALILRESPYEPRHKCCKITELSLENDITPFNFQKITTEAVNVSIYNLVESIRNTDEWFDYEKIKIEQLIALCKKKGIEKEEIKAKLNDTNYKFDEVKQKIKNVSNSVKKKNKQLQQAHLNNLTEFANSGLSILQIIKEELTHILTHSVPETENNSSIKNQFESLKKNCANDCLTNMTALNQLEQLKALFASNNNAHNAKILKSEIALNKLNNQLNDLVVQLAIQNEIIQTTTRAPAYDEENRLLNMLDQQISTLLHVVKNVSETEALSKAVHNAAATLNTDLTEEFHRVSLADALDLRIQMFIEHNFHLLDLNVNESIHVLLEKVVKQIDKFEFIIADIRKQAHEKKYTLEKQITETQKLFTLVNELLDKNEVEVSKCNKECSLEGQSSIEELSERITHLELKIRHLKPLKNK